MSGQNDSGFDQQLAIEAARQAIDEARGERLKTVARLHAIREDHSDYLEAARADNAACQAIHDLELKFRRLIGA